MYKLCAYIVCNIVYGKSSLLRLDSSVKYHLKHKVSKFLTKKSFIIYDEIGRGTSTYDGMSIARAVAEYTAGKNLGAKAMFATHYHELTELEEKYDGIVNYNVAAKKRGGIPVSNNVESIELPNTESYNVDKTGKFVDVFLK